MSKILLMAFAIFAMFSFSGCTTKLAYDQKYSADLIDGTKVKNTSDTVYMCISDETDTNKMDVSHMMHDNRKYVMHDKEAQLVLRDFLGQYFSKIETIPCDRKNIGSIDRLPVVLIYPRDAGVSFTAVFFSTDIDMVVKNKHGLITKELKGADVASLEANKVEATFADFDKRINILSQRSIFKSLEQNKDFLVDNLK